MLFRSGIILTSSITGSWHTVWDSAPVLRSSAQRLAAGISSRFIALYYAKESYRQLYFLFLSQGGGVASVTTVVQTDVFFLAGDTYSCHGGNPYPFVYSIHMSVFNGYPIHFSATEVQSVLPFLHQLLYLYNRMSEVFQTLVCRD